MLLELGLSSILGYSVYHILDAQNHKEQNRLHRIFQRRELYAITRENEDQDKQIKLYPKCIKEDKDQYGNKELYYRLPEGLSYGDILENIYYLTDGLNCEIVPKQLEGQKAHFKLTILQNHLRDFIPYTDELTRKPDEEGLWVCVGHSRRTLEWINLASRNSSHMGIFGSLGSGKSVLERLIMTSLIINYSPDDVEIWCADLKESTDIDLFGNVSHITRKITNPQQAEKFFKDLFELAQARYHEIKRLGCAGIEEYNKNSSIKMKHLVVMIDEISLLDDKLNESYQKAVMYAKLTAQISRGCGISEIVSSQKADTVLDSTFRSYLHTIVGFRVKTTQMSSLILGSKDDSRLRNISIDTPGRGWLQTDRELKIQTVFISESQLVEMMKPYQIQKQVAK